MTIVLTCFFWVHPGPVCSFGGNWSPEDPRPDVVRAWEAAWPFAGDAGARP